MNTLLTNSYSFSVEKLSRNSKHHSTSQLPCINNFFLSNTIPTNHKSNNRYNRSLNKRLKSVKYSYNTTDSNFNVSKNLNKIRRDIYGNVIEKGGNQKISFRDDLYGKPLVETALIDLKKNVIQKQKKHRKKNGKEIIMEESNDKEEIICSSACFIF